MLWKKDHWPLQPIFSKNLSVLHDKVEFFCQKSKLFDLRTHVVAISKTLNEKLIRHPDHLKGVTLKVEARQLLDLDIGKESLKMDQVSWDDVITCSIFEFHLVFPTSRCYELPILFDYRQSWVRIDKRQFSGPKLEEENANWTIIVTIPVPLMSLAPRPMPSFGQEHFEYIPKPLGLDWWPQLDPTLIFCCHQPVFKHIRSPYVINVFLTYMVVISFQVFQIRIQENNDWPVSVDQESAPNRAGIKDDGSWRDRSYVYI